MPDFTVEEQNLMCIFDTTAKAALLDGIRESLPHVYEPEMKAIMQTVISKVEQMTDVEFEGIADELVADFDE